MAIKLKYPSKVKNTKSHSGQKLVLTGGPSAGKTTLAEILAREFKEKVVVVPEAASILFKGGLPRQEDTLSKVFRQRVIYSLQLELENYYAQLHPNKLLICDRGSLDALGYWPKNSRKNFFQELRTTESKELKRYGWVLHLDTAGPFQYQNNSVRTEDFKTAAQINNKIKKAWAHHPNRSIITNSTDFSVKVQAAINVIKIILKGRP